MTLFLILLFFSILITIILNLLWQKSKNWNFFRRGMNLALFLVTLPQEVQQKEVSLEEYLKTVEQFYSSLVSIKEKKWFKRVLV